MPRIAQIVSTARYLPEREVANAELAARFAALGRPHVIDKLAASTGINRRFYAPENWVTSDLALAAAKEALKRAGRKPEDVDLVMIGTTSPDYVAPNTAVVVQNKVGAKNAGTFDVDCACAAFPAQVAIAAGLLATNTAMKTILLVGVDMIHRLSDPTDPGVFLWGDGDGAAVMEAGDREGFIGAAFQAHGAYAFGWGIASGGTFEPANIDAVKAGRTQMRREAGNYPASVNEDNWPRLFQRLSAECGFTPEQVDQLIFTQISKPSIAIAAQRCKVPVEKCHTIMDAWGYTGSACIPMALDDAVGAAQDQARRPSRDDQFRARLESGRGGRPLDHDVMRCEQPRPSRPRARGTYALAAALLMAPLACAMAQDIRGLEICTAERQMDRRTACLQANVEFLQQELSKLDRKTDAKVAATTRSRHHARRDRGAQCDHREARQRACANEGQSRSVHQKVVSAAS